MRARGRPVLGALAGLLFGIFLDTFLLFRSTLSVGSIAIIIFAAAGLVLGGLWGYLAPLGKRGGKPATTPPTPPASAPPSAEAEA